MTPARVAVAPGAAVVRVAAIGPGGVARLVAELPADRTPGLGAVPADVVGPPPSELLLVHPASWTAERAAAWARDATDLAVRVRTVPAPVAVAALGAATAGPAGGAAGAGPVAVLDVGHSGAEAALVCDGAVVAHRRCSAGGARLDEVVLALLGSRRPALGLEAAAGRAEARRVREELSLQPAAVARLPGSEGAVRIDAEELRSVLTPVLGEAVAVLREVLASAPGGSTPVLLVGGVARAPLLAELVDAEGIAGAVVVPRPDAVAVLAALTLPSPAEPGCAGAAARPAAAPRGAVAAVPCWLPPLPARRGRPARAALVTVAVVGLGGALLGAGTLLPSPRTAGVPQPGAAVPAGVLVQYGYQLDLPPGWEHTGGLPERRRSLLTPAATPEGSDLIAVERTPLGYDAGAEPDRARSELRAEFDDAVAGGSALSDYESDAPLAGRAVTTYRQRDGATVVEWYVLLDGDAQLSVGCRHTPSGAEAVRAACAVVVASVRRS